MISRQLFFLIRCNAPLQINLKSVGKIYKIRLELIGNDTHKAACWKVKKVS